jgi:AcrR family transcriptional regulator
MELFWARGYEGTTLEDLQAAMGGISPPSFYNAFGSKEQLFRDAVDLYIATVGGPTVRALQEGKTAREAVETMLRLTAESFSRPGKPHGCMLVLGATNCAPRTRDRKTICTGYGRARQGSSSRDSTAASPTESCHLSLIPVLSPPSTRPSCTGLAGALVMAHRAPHSWPRSTVRWLPGTRLSRNRKHGRTDASAACRGGTTGNVHHENTLTWRSAAALENHGKAIAYESVLLLVLRDCRACHSGGR